MASAQDPSQSKGTLSNRPDIGDPQFTDWFNSLRGGKDFNHQSVAYLCIATMIFAARDLLNSQQSREAQRNRESARFWIENPDSSMLSFSFCCKILDIRLPPEEARALFLKNLPAIANLNLPNTGLPLEYES